MNSLFNYELDERKIRLTLKDADLQFSEAAWEDFDQNYEVAPVRQAMNFRMPNIQLNVNRNILVPVFFVIALAGLSGLLLSFVDFKENKPVQAEKSLEPEAANYDKKNTVAVPAEKKQAEAKQDQVVPTNPAPKEVEPGLAKSVINTPVTDTMPKTSVAASAVIPSNTNTAQLANTAASASLQNSRQYSTSAPVNRAARKPDSIQAYVPPVASDINNNSTNSRGRRHKKQISGEQIEMIKVPAIITTESLSEDDGELKLQLQ